MAASSMFVLLAALLCVEGATLCFHKVIDSLDNPVGIAHTADALLIAEQRGRIWTFDERLDRRLLLDLEDRVFHTNPFLDEKGLLSIAAHPADSSRLYVLYSALNANATHITRLSEFVDDSEFILLEVAQPTERNNGGQVIFSPDDANLLYVTFGDGGEPNSRTAQDVTTLLGSVVRLNVTHSGDYTIPRGNPFGTPIFAYGMRNPWKCTFDREGVLFCADVGENGFEEVNEVFSGENYGWPLCEGSGCGFQSPRFAYAHVTEGNAVIGGAFMRATIYGDELEGSYVFGDFVSGVRLLNADFLLESTNLTCDPLKSFLFAFGEDRKHRIYVAASDSFGTGQTDSAIYRLDPVPISAAPAHLGMAITFFVSLCALVLFV